MRRRAARADNRDGEHRQPTQPRQHALCTGRLPRQIAAADRPHRRRRHQTTPPPTPCVAARRRPARGRGDAAAAAPGNSPRPQDGRRRNARARTARGLPPGPGAASGADAPPRPDWCPPSTAWAAHPHTAAEAAVTSARAGELPPHATGGGGRSAGGAPSGASVRATQRGGAGASAHAPGSRRGGAARRRPGGVASAQPPGPVEVAAWPAQPSKDGGGRGPPPSVLPARPKTLSGPRPRAPALANAPRSWRPRAGRTHQPAAAGGRAQRHRRDR